MTMRTLMAALAAAFLLALTPAKASAPAIAIQIVIDNGGAVQEEGFEALITASLAGLANLRGREFREARIDLILTSDPRTVWSGSPQALMREARPVLELAALTNRCSDLVRALAQADQNLRIAAAEGAWLIIVSPLIHAGFPCDSGPPITLPQPVPEGVALGGMVGARGLDGLILLGVHPSQERVWSDFLEAEGILRQARSGALAFTFLGMEQSRSFLERGRLIERSTGQ